jgi:hypothetical protein
VIKILNLCWSTLFELWCLFYWVRITPQSAWFAAAGFLNAQPVLSFPSPLPHHHHFDNDCPEWATEAHNQSVCLIWQPQRAAQWFRGGIAVRTRGRFEQLRRKISTKFPNGSSF